MIEFEEVRRRFVSPPVPGGASRAVDAVAGVTLAWPESGVRAVVGPNGAGKTTLLALLLGFLFPTDGRVSIAGEEPRRYLRRHGAGFLPERFGLPGPWPVRAALRGLARLEGYDRRAARDRADAAIDRFELGAYAGTAISDLSRGLLQRVGIAQALLGDRRLIVLDEPTEGLDPLWRIRFRDLVRELTARGRTVVVASHDLTEVERLADEVVLMQGGRVRETLPAGPAHDEARFYTLVLAQPHPAVADAFPGAARVEADPDAADTFPGAAHAVTDQNTADRLPDAPQAEAAAGPASSGGPAAYRVAVADAAELTQRLAALIAAGATIRSVAPETEALERRFRRVLGEGGES